MSPLGTSHHSLPLPRLGRRLAAAIGAAALVVGGGGFWAADASTSGHAASHLRRVAPPADSAAGAHGAAAAAAAAGSNDEFTTTANPVSLDPPIPTPSTKPTVVTLIRNHQFGNGAPPALATVTLPRGQWSTVVLDIVGREKGRQYDRTMTIFDDTSQIFLGTTPEPTAAGIKWHVQKDVTGYLPILRGSHTFTITLANYTSDVDNGIPTMTVNLEFYPAGDGFHAARPASVSAPALAGDATTLTGVGSTPERPRIPDSIVPVVPTTATTGMTAIGSGDYTAAVALPNDITTATLDLYLEHQSTDEFFYGYSPSFREIDVAVDGQPAGVVWPFPVIYTGGINPLLWRPLTAIHTLEFPSYRLDLTPFAGILHGNHTITVTVVGNAGYWNVSANLLLTENHGIATHGAVTVNTLTFPGTSTVTTTNVFGQPGNTVPVETASRSYHIKGVIRAANGSWTDDLRQNLQYTNDQSNLGSTTQYLHLERTYSTTETTTGSDMVPLVRRSKASYTTDAPESFLQSADGADFFLPAQVSQQLSEFNDQTGGTERSYSTTLLESVEGYAALEEDSGVHTIDDGSTSGMVAYTDSTGRSYQRSIVTHGGVIEQDIAR